MVFNGEAMSVYGKYLIDHLTPVHLKSTDSFSDIFLRMFETI